VRGSRRRGDFDDVGAVTFLVSAGTWRRGRRTKGFVRVSGLVAAGDLAAKDSISPSPANGFSGVKYSVVRMPPVDGDEMGSELDHDPGAGGGAQLFSISGQMPVAQDAIGAHAFIAFDKEKSISALRPRR